MAPCLISVVFDYLLWLIMDLTYTSITITAIAVITTTFVIVTLIWKAWVNHALDSIPILCFPA